MGFEYSDDENLIVPLLQRCFEDVEVTILRIIRILVIMAELVKEVTEDRLIWKSWTLRDSGKKKAAYLKNLLGFQSFINCAADTTHNL